MYSCWALDPARRPTAAQLVEKLSEDVLHLEPENPISFPPDHPYYNVKSSVRHHCEGCDVCEEQESD